jgi:ATP synthase protein I
MHAKAAEHKPAPANAMAEAARKEEDRHTHWRTEGEPSVMRFVGQIGVLGWIIVAPTLLGLFIGRWLDRSFDTGIFWSAALLFLGVTLGFWLGWRWMHRQ